ncbi:hypothetical protein Cgig2_026071 [Carnegiea gigantea]|uniref:SREBP regulating gene protein n=1 Tax=Carnegiea gigantea TaxID=171969 RepID=A0A9Q1KLI0_9CARY|nr:hypothetical protein Cgig2_026071 [Carnegiea gigantea]
MDVTPAFIHSIAIESTSNQFVGPVHGYNGHLFDSASRNIKCWKDVAFQVRACRNTVQGRYLLADDSGYVCGALSVDPESRCCPRKGDQYSCLLSLQTQKELAVQVKIAKAEAAGTYNSVFDFCAGRCRHNSESVVHENAYVSDFHHCFALPSNTSGSSEPLVELRLAGISIVVGRQGESCDSVCKLSGQSCVPGRLLSLNQCEIMQKYMNCKGGCLASIGPDQPAEVVDDAPKHLSIDGGNMKQFDEGFPLFILMMPLEQPT